MAKAPRLRFDTTREDRFREEKVLQRLAARFRVDEKDVRHGCHLEAGSPPFRGLTATHDGDRCRAYGEDGSFIGILYYDASSSRWRPRKVFIPARGPF